MYKAQVKQAALAAHPADIAIVGMASHFPDAATLYEFWTNVVNKKDSIVDVDTMDGGEYWRKADFFDPNPAAIDKTYGHKAGFVPAIEFDPVEFKLPPLMLDSISTAQIFALYVAKQAMLDARLFGENQLPVDRDKVGVILGGAGNGNTSFSLGSRQQAPYLKKIMLNSGLSEAVADDIIERANNLYLDWTEDSFPGFLGNVACGRIASYFDLGGTSYMVDAACASSLAAVKAAMGELADGSCDVVLTGGVNLENSVFSFLCFSKTPALSKSNISRPFDEDSDGMMLGDGVGFLVLKRLADAERDGDRIYAVIKSLQASSDGRAKSIFAPRFEGQVKAMQRAYARANVTPADIQLLEAHGTGTASGDKTEIKSLRAIYEACNVAPNSVAIGSVKSQIGHTRCAAGAASMMKVALGLFHKVLPPTINVKQPSSDLVGDGAPFYVNTESRPWFRPANGAPRRAALSAFGFGGTNYHAILEEYKHEPVGNFRLNQRPEVVLLHAPNVADLRALCESKLSAFSAEDGGLQWRMHQQANANTVISTNDARLSFVASNVEQVVALLNIATTQLQSKGEAAWEHPQGIYFKPSAPSLAGQVVALFPGQGAQYVNMGRALLGDYPQMRQVLEGMDAQAAAWGLPALSSNIYPVPVFDEQLEMQQMAELTRSSRAQPAIGALSAGYFKLLHSMGLRADFMAGHSYGEVTALWAAGVLDDQAFYQVSLARGAAIEAPSTANEAGAMLAASISKEDAEKVLLQFNDVIVANYNSPQQLVFGGASASIQALQASLSAQHVRSQILPVAAAFHTAYVQHACAPFQASLAKITFSAPRTAVFSSATGERHSTQPSNIAASLITQLVSPVRFTQTIERIYAEGGRVFIEMGPKGILSKLVADILKGKPHTVVAVNPSANGEEALQFKRAIAKLMVEGVAFNCLDPQLAPLPVAAPKKKSLTFTMRGGFFLSTKAKQKRERALRLDNQKVQEFLAQHRAAAASVADPAQLAQQVKTQVEEQVAKQVAAAKQALEIAKAEEIAQLVAKSTQAEAQAQSTVAEIVKAADAVKLACEIKVAKAEQEVRAAEEARLALEKASGKSQPAVVAQHLVQTGMARKSPQHAFHGEVMMQNGNPENDVLSVLDAQIHAQNVLSQVHQQFQLNQKDYIQFLNNLVSKQHALLEKFHDSHQLQDVVGSLSQSLQLLDKNQEMYHLNHEHYFENQQIMLGSAGSRAARSAGNMSARIAQRAPVGIAAAVSEPAPLLQAASPVVAAPEVKAAVSPVATPVAAPVVAPAAPVAVAPVAPAAPVAVAPIQAPKPSVQQMPVAAPVAAVAPAAPAAPVASAPAVQLSAADLATIARFEAITQADLVRQLIDIVSDRTGYPADMINENMDLESDLGIDSIKRLEILGAMFDALATSVPQFQNAEEHKEMETFDIDAFSTILRMANFFEDTIAELLAKLKNGGVDAPAAAAEPVAVAAAPVVNQAISIVETPQANAAPLRKIGVVTSSRKAAVAQEDQAAKKSSAESRDIASAPAQRSLVSDAETTVSDTIFRFQAQKISLPKPDQTVLQLAAGQIWLVTDDGQGLSNQFIPLLLAQGQTVVRLQLGWQPTNTASRQQIQGVSDYCLNHADEQAMQSLLAQIVAAHGEIGGLVHLSPAAPQVQSVRDSFSGQHEQTALMVFCLAKLLQPGFAAHPQAQNYFFCVSQLDGQLGMAQNRAFPVLEAGMSGLTKSLGIEWSGVFCRTLDLDPACQPRLAAEMLLEELRDSRSDLAEVGRGADGQRMTISMQRRHSTALVGENQIGANSVFLVTGGGRGITAQCVIAMAQRYPARFALLGRTSIDAALPVWAEGSSDAAALKARAIAYLQAQGEPITPVKVDKMLREVAQTLEVKQTVALIRQAGGRAMYFACDITDANDVARVVSSIEQSLGPVTGVIHGAGNLADKRIEKKSAADFNSVFATKVTGLRNILEALNLSQVRHMVLFSSVSGFFGNAGQTDYAMANQVLDKFAYLLKQQYPQMFVRSINWGPWDTGMVNDVLKRAYAERGLAIIPTATGIGYFVDEFLHTEETQVIIGGGAYKVARKQKSVPSLQRFSRHLLAANNPFVQEHVVDGKPVLPATAAIAWMVQACEDVLPGYCFEKLQDFRVLKGVVFDQQEQEHFVAEVKSVAVSALPAEHANDKPGERHVFDVSIFNQVNGKALQRYQARITLGLQTRPAPSVPALPLLNTKLNTPAMYGDMQAGSLLFHGAAFRGIHALRQIDQNGLRVSAKLAVSSVAKQGQFALNSFNPYVADVFLQTPLVWLMLQTELAGLPSQIAEWQQFAPSKFEQEIEIVMELAKEGGAHSKASLLSNLTVYSKEGQLLSKISGLGFTVSKKLRQMLCGAEISNV